MFKLIEEFNYETEAAMKYADNGNATQP